jgi:prepilin-type N-terminal cleavage/methylation domain-containing protein
MLLPPRRPGYTLVELALVLVVVGLMTTIAARQMLLHLDRMAARAAAGEAASVVMRARDDAVAQRAMVSVLFDTTAAALEVRARGRRTSRVALGSAHGVALSANRDSLTFDVRGLGYGAANLTLVLRRGRAAESVVVSRLGRVRY